MDFRDQIVQDALKQTVRPYRPEKTPRARARRIAIVVLLTIATCAGFWTILAVSTPKAPPPARPKAVPVQLLPPSSGEAARRQ